ncbi:MAG: ZIP family metal transporter [Nanoarchaeota archaeon]|nr:ZIP family metal transporter [Nanoarchaeota archaeon]
MELFFIVLVLTAVFQIAGVIIPWLAVKEFGNHINKVIIAEVAFMIIISLELVYFGTKVTYLALGGVVLGVMSVFVLNSLVPHKHEAPLQRLSYLIFAAMCMHELPEGMAFGSSYILNHDVGLFTALLVSLHNIPEGSIVAFPFIIKKKFRKAIEFVGVTQALYVAGGLITYFLLFSVSETVKTVMMCFAAGAMMFIAFEELKFIK